MFLPQDTLVLCADLPKASTSIADTRLRNPTLKKCQGSLISASVSPEGDLLVLEGSNLEEMLKTAANEIAAEKKANCTKIKVNGVILDYPQTLTTESVYNQISSKFTLVEIDIISMEIQWKDKAEAPNEHLDLIRMAHLIASEELRCIRFTIEDHTIEASPSHPPIDTVRKLNDLKHPPSAPRSDLPETARHGIFA